MDKYLYLMLGEIFIIILIIGVKLFLNYLENKKIKYVLDFINKKSEKSDKMSDDRFNECINIIKNSKEM